jgi:hypothetical protein
MQLNMMTYRDAVDRAIDYMGAATDATTERFARDAVQSAYDEICGKRNWVYYLHRNRITTQAPYSTGTVQYQHSGGAVPRQLTLTGGTWPSWAGEGTVAIASIPHIATGRISDTVLQLATYANPGQNVASGTAYRLWQDTYTLPPDFGSSGDMVAIGWQRQLTYVTPDEHLRLQRLQLSPAQPWCYTIRGDDRKYGALAVTFYYPPDQVLLVDYTYRRRPRQLRVLGESTGTASITSSSTAVTGSGTAFLSSHVGSVIRFASDNLNGVPTGLRGANPYTVERTIVAYTSATSVTLDQDPQQSLTNVAYSISDPVDVEPGAMLNYFMQEVRRQCRMARRMESSKDEERQYQEHRIAAYEADARHHDGRTSMGGGLHGSNAKYMPTGPDMG